jgi:hypothetical protein
MSGLGAILSSVNVVLCLLALWFCVKRRMVSSIIWFMNAYFAWFLVLMASNGQYSRTRGFTAELISVKQSTIDFLAGYALIFNCVFAVGFGVVWFVFRGKGQANSSAWSRKGGGSQIGAMSAIFLAFLVVGGALYWWKMRGIGYRGYVEFQFQGSNWPLVFLWASSPFISLMALKRRYVWALGGAAPFLFFAWHLNVRSFALLSLVPLVLIYFFQRSEDGGASKRSSLWMFLRGLPIIVVLLAASIVITYNKQARLTGVPDEGQLTGLPDAGLVYGAGLVFESLQHVHYRLEFNSLKKYAVNVAGPFVKIAEKTLGIPPIVVEDTPVYMARLIDGVPKGFPIYHHYPVLWYSDALISFGNMGLCLALFWGVLAAFWERIMLWRTGLLGVLLPFYCWHMYMLIRGATAVAAAPLTYSAYVALIVYFLFARLETVRNRNGAVEDKPRWGNVLP